LKAIFISIDISEINDWLLSIT